VLNTYVTEKMEARGGNGSLGIQRLHPLLCSSGVSPWVIHPTHQRVVLRPNLLQKKLARSLWRLPLKGEKRGSFLGWDHPSIIPRRKVSFGQGRGIGRLPTYLLASAPPMHGFYVMWESRLDASDRGAWMGGQTHAS
jgi:hypothetical protein